MRIVDCNDGHPQGWPSSPLTMRMEAARVCAYLALRYLEPTVAPPNDIDSIARGALERIFQLLCD